MNLFQLGDFTLASGRKSRWKIECDCLTSQDWMALAQMAAEILPPFQGVIGVPRGGTPFAAALWPHTTKDSSLPILLAEDVVTTGGSLERFKTRLEGDPDWGPGPYIGVCAFARGPVPSWVTPLFTLTCK